MSAETRRWLFVVTAVLAMTQGCAGFDEWKCGPGYHYTSGVCKGFGPGFRAHEALPAAAREMNRTRGWHD